MRLWHHNHTIAGPEVCFFRPAFKERESAQWSQRMHMDWLLRELHFFFLAFLCKKNLAWLPSVYSSLQLLRDLPSERGITFKPFLSLIYRVSEKDCTRAQRKFFEKGTIFFGHPAFCYFNCIHLNDKKCEQYRVEVSDALSPGSKMHTSNKKNYFPHLKNSWNIQNNNRKFNKLL
jgi:hypothetical protein